MAPVPGKDYPRDLPEFRAWFATEEACVAYVAKVRWRRGFRCPACGGARAWITAKGLRHCQACGRQVSATAGTIFAGTRKPLQTWFDVMWAVTSNKNGASAASIARSSGFRSYQTAWTWLHKLRRAMVRPDRDRLRGVVEVDHRLVGGAELGGEERYTYAQATVVIAVEVQGPRSNEPGRMRLTRVPRLGPPSVSAFIEATVTPGSTVVTPRADAYAGLVLKGYEHVKSRGQATPVVGRLWPPFELWWRGTHRGAIRHRQLDYYLDEYAFRHNRRRSKATGRLFYALLEQAVETPPVPYKHLIARRKAPLRPPPAASPVTRSDPTRLQDRLEADG